MHVVVSGLKADARLNGQHGVIWGWSDGRFKVRVGKCNFRIRPTNLVAAPELTDLQDTLRKVVVVHLDESGKIDAFGFWLDPSVLVEPFAVERIETWFCLKSASVPKTAEGALEMETVSIAGPHKSNLLFLLTDSKERHDTAIVVEVAWTANFVAQIHRPSFETYVKPCFEELQDKVSRVMSGDCDRTVSMRL